MMKMKQIAITPQHVTPQPKLEEIILLNLEQIMEKLEELNEKVNNINLCDNSGMSIEYD